MKKITLFFWTIILSLILTSCTNNDDNPTIDNPLLITETEFTYLHNNDSKNWRITNYYSNFANLTLDTNLTNCIKDDLYTFFANDDASITEFGDTSCYDPSVSEEISGAVYNYYPQEQKLYLDFSRGYYSSQTNISDVTLRITKCILLTPDTMIFTSGGDNNSGIGLVFEKVD